MDRHRGRPERPPSDAKDENGLSHRRQMRYPSATKPPGETADDGPSGPPRPQSRATSHDDICSGQERPAGGGALGTARRIEGLGTKTEVLLADEAPITEIDELRPLIAEGQERGFLTFEQIASALEEVEVTKEQVAELHAYLEEQGIDVVGDDGKPATSEGGRFERGAGGARDKRPTRRASRRSTSRSSRASTRCGSTCARSAGCSCSPPSARSRSPSASSAATWSPSRRWSRPTCASSSRSPRATWAAACRSWT